MAERLDEVRLALAAIDDRGPGATVDDYAPIAQILDEGPVEADPSRLLQVDMLKPAVAASLGPSVVEELARAVEVLHRLAPPAPVDDPLTTFNEAFRDRYGEAEVPLVEALDEEIGIGFAADATDESAPLLDGIDLGQPPSQGANGPHATTYCWR